MATPCCPKCGKTSFHRVNHLALRAALIYCTACGAVVGAVPVSGSGGGKTSSDDWEART